MSSKHFGNKIPETREYLNKRAKVLFHYGGDTLMGVIVRDDMEAPFLTIIKLDDGRHVLATECQYSPI